jgi:hypothetical protein
MITFRYEKSGKNFSQEKSHRGYVKTSIFEKSSGDKGETPITIRNFYFCKYFIIFGNYHNDIKKISKIKNS